MQTMVIRIGEVAEEDGSRYYPVSLHIDDGNTPDWAEQPVARVSLPADLPSAKDHPDLDLSSIQRALRTDNAPPPTLMAIGRYLYQLLAENAVGAAWTKATEAYQAAANGSGRLRTFFDVRPAELRALPWELMARSNGRQLFLDEDHLCVRGRYDPGPAEPMLVPLRLLVAVGDPHDTMLRADDEVDAIWRATRDHPGEWHVEVLWGPTQNGFAKCYKQVRPHIFHFIGHSGMSPYNHFPALEFRPADGTKTWFLHSQIIANMPKAAAPRLVFLNSCRTTEPLADEEIEERLEGAIGVAGAFEDLGSRAVLAMQADIPSDPAVRFTREVYRRLAEGEAIDVAVRGGRERVFEAETDPRDWALPSLTVSGNPESLLSVRLGLAREVARRLIDERYSDVKALVDRTAEHRRLWGGVDCDKPPSSVLLVTGDHQVGKSALVKSCLFTWNLRGVQAVYVDLKTFGGNVNWLNVVRVIRDGLATCLPERAAEPIRRFNHDLAYRCKGLEPELPLEAGGRTDDGGLWAPGTEHEPELRAAVFAAARRMLEEVAGAEPLLLAVDHLAAGLADDIRNQIVPWLLLPIAEGQVDHVSVILVESSDRTQELLPDRLRRAETVITVHPFTRDVHFFRQYGALTRRPFADTYRQIAEALQNKHDLTMMPCEFGFLAGLVPESEEVNW